MSGIPNIPRPHNEPVLTYAPGTAERAALKSALTGVGAERPDIPAVVGGREIRSGKSPRRGLTPLSHPGPGHGFTKRSEHDRLRRRVRGRGPARLGQLALRGPRGGLPPGGRHAGDDAPPARERGHHAGPEQDAFQAEIDSACELIDFLRFNVHFAERIYREQPESAPGAWNRMDHRPLEGFVYAITPFNFTAIGGNLPTAPALMGNAVGVEADRTPPCSATGTSTSCSRRPGCRPA